MFLCNFYYVSVTEFGIHTFLALLSVNPEVFWKLAEWQFLHFCSWKLRQYFLFLFFFLRSICLGVCILSAEAQAHTVYMQFAQRRHAQNLRVLQCTTLGAFSLWPWKWEGRAMRSVVVGSLRPTSLVSRRPAAGGDKGSFWREVTAGERKGVMAAVREPGKDKEACHRAGFRTAGFRGSWGVAARCRMLLAS